MDKQKQIEEMARDMSEYGMEKYPTGDSVFTETKLREQFYHVFLTYAEYLINEGYRKIPEGAVVLTGMETEQRFEDLMVAFDEMGFMPNTTHPFPEEYVETWKQRLIFVFGQLRKETAEKFAEVAKEAIINMKWARDDTHIKLVTQGDCLKAIDEICKEIVEGERQNCV